MASLIPGYEYDIFISYRQKDNKYDGWVTEFVDNLKRELEATFKEDVNLYFDINPHDGLLETHDVEASLKEKIRCLVFVPIISHTYCDPKSFAWEHEFKAFIELASHDQFGLKVKLTGGNVTNRVLPVRIHDLDAEDIKLCESVLGGYLRGVEFIYREPGVNRSLTPADDEKKNLNKTRYRNQINKVANAVKEIIAGLKTGQDVSSAVNPDSQLPWEEVKKVPENSKERFKKSKLLSYSISAVFILVLLGVYVYPKIFKRDSLEKLRSSGEKISIAVMPFQNMTNDTTLNMWEDGIQDGLITSFSNVKELKIRQKESIKNLLQIKGLTEFASLSPATAGTVSRKLDADIFIYGSIKKAGSLLRVDAQIIDTKTNDILKSFELNRPFKEEIFFDITDSLRKKITDFLLISNLIKENPGYERYPLYTNSYEAFRYFIYGNNSFGKGDWPTAREWFLKALAVDSSYLLPMNGLSMAYGNQGLGEQSLYWLLKLYKKRDLMSPILQLWTDLAYASSFEPPEVSIGYLRQIQQIDEQPSVYHMLGVTYYGNKEFDKAIPEFEKCLDLSGKWGKEFLEYNFAFPALGEAYHFTGRYKDEIKLYKRAEQANNDQTSIYFSWIIRDQATLSLTLGDTVAANRYIKKFISVLRKNSTSEAEIAYGMALMYRSANKLDTAEEYYRKALSLEPKNPYRMNTLANRLIDRNKNFDEAYELLDKAMALAANKSDYFGFMDSKGMGLYKQGKYKEALELLQKMYDSAPYKLYYMKSHLEEVKKAVAGKK